MPIVSFARAVRKGAHAIITAYGESGCGKTYSLIRLGRGLVGPKGKLGMLDSETGRGLIYATVGGGYEYAELSPPFTPERYVEAIDIAEEAGIEALILDSGSHEWEGLGGVLEIAEANNLRGLVKWAGPKARHKRYVQRLLNSRMHLLISLRAKEKMIQLTDKMPIPRGMKVGDIISGGFVPIQDKRFIFETTVQLFLPTSTDRRKLGIPVIEKCPEDLWGAFPEGEQISEETGRRIAEWISGGAPIDHSFERMKRAAEDAAGQGTEVLREHFVNLDKTARQRLSSQTDNLRSIADAADREKELRQREAEQGAAEPDDTNLDHPFGDRGVEFADGAETDSPAGAHEPETGKEDTTEAKTDGTGPLNHSDQPAGSADPRSWQKRFDALDPGRGDLAGSPYWPEYVRDVVALIGEATAADLDGLRLTTNPRMTELRRTDGDGYRQITEAVTARAKALVRDAAN